MRLMYFMLTDFMLTDFLCQPLADLLSARSRIGAASTVPPPPRLDTGVEAGLEGSDVLGLPRDGAEAGTTGAELR
jgi:hypothetical protein